MLWRAWRLGFWESIDTTFTAVGPMVCTLQILAFLEIFNVLLGITKSSVGPTLAQVLGRNHVLLVALIFVPEVYTHWGVALMFFIWGLSELIRYPLYLYTINNSTPPQFLQFLRYNAFIILYPIGFAAENVLWYNMLPYIKEREIHSVRLPNSINFGFDYYYFVIFWICTTLLVFPFQYMFMFKLRSLKNKKKTN
ncbi:hypothetical protein DICPUDRAFT_89327 [Dictyostelium purpureum]|uniref:very-long-chain (3R)-3-hydroxyacyl-CoA dehydratase n=1 Tax=Dictyostelium purpureum TaxID=5786 RepID=F0ZV62_DICPU|nr:uncharacterized protein DICPUDRAFT_89327 [Dictyostelium purpureum]EGC32165.1 hypothetical protein DICPUDRAFT_89327 [Dictyostelium purpureum]|eukprot:XP_003291303.1 hypothetical protein DICPUDRAFT_89327 [Dictyostelium purpureum]